MIRYYLLFIVLCTEYTSHACVQNACMKCRTTYYNLKPLLKKGYNDACSLGIATGYSKCAEYDQLLCIMLIKVQVDISLQQENQHILVNNLIISRKCNDVYNYKKMKDDRNKWKHACYGVKAGHGKHLLGICFLSCIETITNRGRQCLNNHVFDTSYAYRLLTEIVPTCIECSSAFNADCVIGDSDILTNASFTEKKQSQHKLVYCSGLCYVQTTHRGSMPIVHRRGCLPSYGSPSTISIKTKNSQFFYKLSFYTSESDGNIWFVCSADRGLSCNGKHHIANTIDYSSKEFLPIRNAGIDHETLSKIHRNISNQIIQCRRCHSKTKLDQLTQDSCYNGSMTDELFDTVPCYGKCFVMLSHSKYSNDTIDVLRFCKSNIFPIMGIRPAEKLYFSYQVAEKDHCFNTDFNGTTYLHCIAYCNAFDYCTSIMENQILMNMRIDDEHVKMYWNLMTNTRDLLNERDVTPLGYMPYIEEQMDDVTLDMSDIRNFSTNIITSNSNKNQAVFARIYLHNFHIDDEDIFFNILWIFVIITLLNVGLMYDTSRKKSNTADINTSLGIIKKRIERYEEQTNMKQSYLQRHQDKRALDSDPDKRCPDGAYPANITKDINLLREIVGLGKLKMADDINISHAELSILSQN